MPTFTHIAPGTHDPLTGGFSSPTTTTYTGEAIELPDGPETQRFRDEGRIDATALVLLFTPDTYAEDSLPPVGSTVAWGSHTLTVTAHLSVVRPDAIPIVAYLACRR
jgi:hypothetical protein